MCVVCVGFFFLSQAVFFHVVARWLLVAPGLLSIFRSSSHSSKVPWTVLKIDSHLPHLSHMSVLEPISMTNGMDNADWPGLGHVLPPSLSPWQPWLEQVYPNHMDSERQNSVSSKDNQFSVTRRSSKEDWIYTRRDVLCNVISV